MQEHKKLKIGLFIDSFYPMVDGVINVVDNYARILSKEHDVTVFTLKPRKKGFDDSTLPYKVVRCNRIPILFLDYDLPIPKLSKNFKKELKNSQFDIIHIHSPFTIGKLAVKYGKKNNIPTIATLHSQYYKDFLRATHNIKWLADLILKSVVNVFNMADYRLTMNLFSKELLKSYGCNKETFILKNGCDMVNDTHLSTLKQEANKLYNLNNEFVLLYVGRINLLKNLEFIINAIKKLPQELNYKLILAGDGKDKKYIENLISKNNLNSKVIMTGKITDRKNLKCLYARADLFLFPSTCDADGIVKTEASCFGVPSICVENTGAGSAITNNVNGFLINEKLDETELANLITKLEKDRELLIAVGKQAYKDLYVTWEDVVKDLKTFYYKIINK